MRMALKGTLPTALLLLSMFTSFAQIPQGEDEFHALITRYYAAWNTLNPDIAAQLYAKDPGLVFYDIAPLKYKGWEEYKEGTRKMLSEFIRFEVELNISMRTDLKMKLIPYYDLQVSRR